MTVYVDNAQILWRGMLMSHMTADTMRELHGMAEQLGLRRAWFQDKSIPHYDLSEGKRQQALKLGAVEEDLWAYNGDRLSFHTRERRRRARVKARRVLARRRLGSGVHTGSGDD